MKLVNTISLLLTLVLSIHAQVDRQVRVLNLKGMQPARTVACGSLMLLWITNQPCEIMTILKPAQVTPVPSASETPVCKVQVFFGADIVGFATLTGSRETPSKSPSEPEPARFRLKFETVEQAVKAAALLQQTGPLPSPLQPGPGKRILTAVAPIDM